MKHVSTILMLLIFAPAAVAQEAKKTDRWEPSIVALEKKITDGSSKPGSVVFVGSSSIKLWDLPKWFPDGNVVNNGFGGSQISDSVRYFDRIVTPLHPPLVIMYAGDNDVSAGKSPETVHRDFLQFAEKVKRHLPPESKLAFIAIKPSIKRWNLSEKMNEANQMIAKECEADDRLIYLDIWKPMLGEDGKPKPELFAKDGLHLNDEGYKLWTSIVKSELNL